MGKPNGKKRGKGLEASLTAKKTEQTEATSVAVQTPAKKAPLPLWQKIILEARAVTMWVALAAVARILIELIASVKLMKTESCPDGQETCEMELSEVFGPFSMKLIHMVSWIFPYVRKPGFVYASPWLLLFIRRSYGVFPNVATRIAEMLLGRISLQELLVLLPVHILCTMSALTLFRRAMPTSLEYGLQTIDYATDEASMGFQDFAREAYVTAMYVVGLLVVPTLCELNRIPNSMIPFFLVPLMYVGVDNEGQGSVVAPNLLYCLSMLHGIDGIGQSLDRLAGSQVGAIIAGIVMRFYFPDSPRG